MNLLLRRWSRLVLGVLLGALTAPVELLFVLVGGGWLGLAPGRGTGGSGSGNGAWVHRSAQWLAVREQRRIGRYHETETPVPRLRAGGRALAYLAVRWMLGLLGGAVLLTVLLSLGYSSFLLWGWFVIGRLNHPGTVLLTAFTGLFALFLSAQGVRQVAVWDEQLLRNRLGPDDRQLLERRIGELAATRAGVIEAVDDERRRIERDLHDGVQQRLVALGMLIGRARRATDPAKSDALLRQAHEESREALTELREVAWRVYPAALDDSGLTAALESVAERSGIPVDLTTDLLGQLAPSTQTVAYFVVAEAVTNAAKHSGATRVTARVVQEDRTLHIRVRDDGSGGADPTGGGLTGLARRVAALDGRFAVDSPAGGPTVLTAEVPCGATASNRADSTPTRSTPT
ncbi:sensor histidine kinase [Streptomyces sp. NA04227]|uniref:sensor histidine kinase n=1 Tax=Streptomyces sp. NA04227 TaxID=2742136 RepID=UPI001591A954|nr:sensor histidine kinase [Streptomyces sp. NA04227]QKW08260.1 sensor histidine kinase [Streptomyces sp. NA04227]